MKNPKLERCPTHKKKPVVEWSDRNKVWFVRCCNHLVYCACVVHKDKSRAIEIWNYVVTEPIFNGVFVNIEPVLPKKSNETPVP